MQYDHYYNRFASLSGGEVAADKFVFDRVVPFEFYFRSSNRMEIRKIKPDRSWLGSVIAAGGYMSSLRMGAFLTIVFVVYSKRGCLLCRRCTTASHSDAAQRSQSTQ